MSFLVCTWQPFNILNLLKIAKGTLIFFSLAKKNTFLFYSGLHIPFHGIYSAIATITITVAWLVYFFFILFLFLFNVLLSGRSCPILLLLTISPIHRNAKICIFLVSSDFALFSQPWYIWYSHVHINNVYRNLRAMLTSTFPLRLNIFVLFSYVLFFFHHFACVRSFTISHHTHTNT